METVSLQDEKIDLGECAPAVEPESAAEAPKKRGRPAKVEMTQAERDVFVEKEKSRIEQEYKAEKAARKARPALKVWYETNGKKTIKFTRTAEGNVYRELAHTPIKKKA